MTFAELDVGTRFFIGDGTNRRYRYIKIKPFNVDATLRYNCVQDSVHGECCGFFAWGFHWDKYPIEKIE